MCLRPVSIPKGFLSHCLGPHIVAVGRIKGGDVPWERLRILDKQERVVREIRGTGIFAVEFRELTGKPPKELYVSSFDGETRYCAKIIVSEVLQQWLYLIFQQVTPRNLRGLEIRSSQARVLGEWPEPP